MPLSWNEIRSRALEFSKRWENDTSENAEEKSFWTEFFTLFCAAAQAVLDARAQFMSPSPQSSDTTTSHSTRPSKDDGQVAGYPASGRGSSLADLYGPLTMPSVLVKAHQALDRAVDASYRKTAFNSDAQRVEFLFGRYQQLTSLLPAPSV